jgi:hypothetical protein
MPHMPTTEIPVGTVAVPNTRSIGTEGGLEGGGDLSADRVHRIATAGVTTAKIADNAVTLAKLADIANARVLGRVTSGTGDPESLTGTQVTALLDTFTTSSKGAVPPPGSSTGTNALLDNGTWGPAGDSDTRDIFRVTSYGAAVTGATDATAGIQAAITAAIANVTATGRTSVIFFPAGTYACSAKVGIRQFDLNNRSKLVFAGTPGGRSRILMNGDAGAGDWYLFHVRGGSTDIEFRDLVLDMDGLTNPDPAEQNHLVQVGTNARNVRFFGCEFRNTVGDGIRMFGEFGAPVDDVLIDRCRFFECERCSISFQRWVRGVKISNCEIIGGTDQQLDFEPTGYGLVASASGGSSTVLNRTGSQFLAWGVQAGDPIFSQTDDFLGFVVSVDSETQLTTTAVPSTWNSADFYFPLHCSNHHITNNRFRRTDNTDIVVTLTSGWGVTFERNVFEGCIQALDLMRSRIAGNVFRPRRHGDADQTAVLLLKSTLDVDIEDNHFYMNATATNVLRWGIKISPTAGRFPHSVTISRNTMRFDTYAVGVGLEGVRRARVSGNRIVLNTPGITNQSRGIYTETASGGPDVQSVTYEGNEISAIAGRWANGLDFNSRFSGKAIVSCSAIGGSLRDCTTGAQFRTSSGGTFTNPPIYQGVINDGVAEVDVSTLSPGWLAVGGSSVSARVFRGAGAPAFAAPIGSLAMRTDGGAGTSLYVNEDGTGTGWVAK